MNPITKLEDAVSAGRQFRLSAADAAWLYEAMRREGVVDRIRRQAIGMDVDCMGHGRAGRVIERQYDWQRRIDEGVGAGWS